MSKPSVVLVEDEIILASLVMQALDDYEVIHCNRAEQFRGIITDQDPDLIIMDIELGEGENGYDLCAWYRDNHSKAQILFLSTHDGFDEITRAYQFGGNDFMIKPVNVNELRAKLLLAMGRAEKEVSRKGEEDFIRKMAFDAMCESGYIGRLLTLSRDVAAHDELGRIMDAVIALVDEYSIDVIIKIRCGQDVRIKASGQQSVSPIELSSMNHLSSMGRLFQFKTKLIINFDNCVILVKNMPDDETRAGLIRDHIAIATEIVDSRVRGLEKDVLLLNRDALLKAAMTVSRKIDAVMQRNAQFAQEQTEVIASVQSEVGKMIHEFYLSEEDEKKLFDTLDVRMGLLRDQHAKTEEGQTEILKLGKEMIEILASST